MRHDGITELLESVHPAGNPMSHSTHVGFNAPPATAFSGRELRENWLGPALFDASWTVGVGNIRTAVSSEIPVDDRFSFAKSAPPGVAFGVGQRFRQHGHLVTIDGQS